MHDTASWINSHSISWELHCDNQAAVLQVQKIQTSNIRIEQSDSDILFSIKKYLPQNGTIRHVKGHTKITQSSTLAEKLNSLVDSKARKAVTKIQGYSPPKSTIKIIINGKPVFRAEAIVSHCYNTISQEYWCNKLGEKAYQLVDWSLFQAIARNFKKEISVLKLLSGITPTKVHQFKIGKSASAKCPLCEEENETISHVGLCSKNPKNIKTLHQKIGLKLRRYGNFEIFLESLFDKIKNPQIKESATNNQDQDIIGRFQIWQGKVSLQMSKEIIPSVKKEKMVSKVKYIIMIQLIKQWKSAWLHRVNVLKRRVEEADLSRNIQTSRQQLSFLYQYKHLLPESQQQLLHVSMEEHLKSSQRHIQTWLSQQYQGLHRIIKENQQQQMESLDPLIPCEAVSENLDVSTSGLH